MSVMSYLRRTILLPAIVADRGVVRPFASPDQGAATTRGLRP